MEQLIERLKAAEEALMGQGIPQAEEAFGKIEELRGMPAYTLGYVVSREISFTVEALYEKGSELQSSAMSRCRRRSGRISGIRSKKLSGMWMIS